MDDVLKRSREQPTKRGKETSEFVEILSSQNFLDTKAWFRRRTFHVPNLTE